MEPRAEQGVNYTLLPDKKRALYNIDLLVDKVETEKGLFPFDEIISKLESGDSVLIPPGVYRAKPILIRNKHNITIKADGCYLIFENHKETAITLHGCESITIIGLSVDYLKPANTQGDVLEVSSDYLVWKAHAGYYKNLLDDEIFHVPEGISPPGEGFRKGENRPFTDLGFSRVEEYGGVGTYKLYGEGSGKMKKCDVIVFRGKPSYVNHFVGCTKVKYQDVSVLSGSGFAVMERDGVGGTYIDRMLITPGPKPKGANEARLVSTCDATHSANMRKGITVKNSIFEKMTDDAANVHSYFGRVKESLSKTQLLYSYGAENHKTINAPVLWGDKLLLFSDDGNFIFETTATCGSEEISEGIFSVEFSNENSVRIPLGCILQNHSATGSGFVYQNCLVDNNRSRGFLIKASGGIIKNCTFLNNGMSAILVKPEIPDGWGECGYVDGLVIENNTIESTGFFSGSDLHSPITIEGDAGTQKQCQRNIVIKNNCFGERYTPFAISINHAENVCICGNVFAGRIKEYAELWKGVYNPLAPDDNHATIKILNGKNVQLKDNFFPPSAVNPVARVPQNE